MPVKAIIKRIYAGIAKFFEFFKKFLNFLRGYFYPNLMAWSAKPSVKIFCKALKKPLNKNNRSIYGL